jgi:hypothetical protein
MQQVFVPKKKEEAPVAPTPKSDPLPSITIGSMEVPIINNDGLSVIEDPTPSRTQDGSTSVAGDVEKEKHADRDPKYM